MHPLRDVAPEENRMDQLLALPPLKIDDPCFQLEQLGLKRIELLRGGGVYIRQVRLDLAKAYAC